MLLVPLFSWFFLRRPIRSSTMGCGLLAFLGMTLLSSPSVHTGPHRLLGDALAITHRGILRGLPDRDSGGARARCGVVPGFRKLALEQSDAVPLVSLAGEKLIPSATTDWLWLIGLAPISQVFGQTADCPCAGPIPPAQAAVGLLIQPVSAAVFAWVLFGEAMSGLQLLGGGLVLASITAVRVFER